MRSVQFILSLTYSLLPICICQVLLRTPDPLHDNRPKNVLRTHHSVSYLYARLPFLCVICNVKQVPEALVGDKLVVCWDNACVSPGCRISLFLFSFQPPLLFQDFLQRKPDCTVSPAISTHLYMWHIYYYAQSMHFF